MTQPAPGFSALMDNLTKVSDVILSEADAAEEMRHMTDATYTAPSEHGFFHMMTPRDLGGSELAFSDGIAVAEQLARLDGSRIG